jgi:hypothetical protein
MPLRQRSETIGAHPHEQVTVREDDTLPVDRCEVCGKPGEWTVSYTGFLGSRNPPYRFWTVTYCDEHLPDDGRAAIPDWVQKK